MKKYDLDTLDTDVAKEIFGFVVVMKDDMDCVVSRDGSHVPVPPYSTDITCAYGILKHFISKGYMVFINRENNYWKFILEYGGTRSVYRCDAFLPASICIVFLEHTRRIRNIAENRNEKEAEIIRIDFDRDNGS